MLTRVLAVTALLSLALTASARADVTAPAQPSFVATSPVLVFHTDGTATTTVQVLNPGSKLAAAFWLVTSPGGGSVPAHSAVATCSGGRGLSTVSLTFDRSFPAVPTSLTGATVQLVPTHASQGAATLCAEAGAAPATSLPHTAAITVSLHRLTGIWTDFVVPGLIGLAFAIFFVLYVRVRCARGLERNAWVQAASTWNFKDNWATNLTAVGGSIGALLAAAGANANLLPGIQTSNFGVLLALWTTLTVVAPLFLAAKKQSVGAGQGKQDANVQVELSWFLVAGAMTLIAVGADLATGGVLVYFSIAGWTVRVLVWLLLAVASGLVLNHAIANACALVGSKQQVRSNLHVGAGTSLAI